MVGVLITCSRGFNILLHGLGSKRRLIEDFRESILGEYSHLVVNGYFPSLTMKSVSKLIITCLFSVMKVLLT